MASTFTIADPAVMRCPVPDCDFALEYPWQAQPGADAALREHLRDEHVTVAGAG